MLAGLNVERLPPLLGYVETRAKPGARAALAAKDGDPLLVFGSCGRGTTAAFTSDATPRWAAAWLRWPDFGRFWELVVRRTLRKPPEPPPPIAPAAPVAFAGATNVAPMAGFLGGRRGVVPPRRVPETSRHGPRVTLPILPILRILSQHPADAYPRDMKTLAAPPRRAKN